MAETPVPKALPVFLLAWLLTGFGAVAGSIVGNAFGHGGLFAGAVLGGAILLAGAVYLAGRLTWLAASSRVAATIGGLIGFAVAAPIAVANLHSPLTPIAITSLAGAGVLLGAGFAKPGAEP